MQCPARGHPCRALRASRHPDATATSGVMLCGNGNDADQKAERASSGTYPSDCKSQSAQSNTRH